MIILLLLSLPPLHRLFLHLYFMGVTAFIVYNGVQDGIEKVSKWMMPVLLVLVVIIFIYSLTLKHTDASGQVHTGLQGFLVLFDSKLLRGLLYRDFYRFCWMQ